MCSRLLLLQSFLSLPSLVYASLLSRVGVFIIVIILFVLALVCIAVVNYHNSCIAGWLGISLVILDCQGFLSNLENAFASFFSKK